MVESSVLGTSPWNSDPFLCKDLNPFPGLDCQSLLDLGLNEPESCSIESRLPFLGDSANSLVQSIEEPVGQDCFWSEHDYLATSTVSSEECPSLLTQDSSCTTGDSLGFENLNWMMEECSWHSDSSSENTIVSPPTFSTTTSPRKKNKAQDPLSPNKSWSRMNGEEQLGTVEALTQIISHQMGLREQLEVIRIIDPKAVVSTCDTEFVIDLGCLNDVKLQRIREYVTRHSHELGGSQGPAGRMTGGKSDGNSSSSSSSSSGSAPFSLHPDNRNSSSRNGDASGKPSKKQLREQHKQWKAWRQRQRKEQRQTLKERRSGLFVKNEVLWLNAAEEANEANEPDPEEEVDILA